MAPGSGLAHLGLDWEENCKKGCFSQLSLNNDWNIKRKLWLFLRLIFNIFFFSKSLTFFCLSSFMKFVKIHRCCSVSCLQLHPHSSSAELCGPPAASQPPWLLNSSSSSSRPLSAAFTTVSLHPSASPQSAPYGGRLLMGLFKCIIFTSLDCITQVN